ncbi:MAG: methyltransferase domain-containing protein, partial [Chloroflexota bacterium]
MNENKIEILSVDLLDQHRLVVNDLRDLAIKVREDFGWHYLLDLVWIIDQLPVKRNAKILDAGAGVGIMQWYLAEKNVDVFSVDRGSRAKLNMKFRSRYKVSGLREDDLLPHISAIKENLISASDLPNLTRRVGRNLVSLFRLFLPADGGGDVILYNQDLKSLLDIEDNSMDAVVAVSALEHNSPDDLRLVVNELFRVLKPGGKLVATLGAGEKE